MWAKLQELGLALRDWTSSHAERTPPSSDLASPSRDAGGLTRSRSILELVIEDPDVSSNLWRMLDTSSKRTVRLVSKACCLWVACTHRILPVMVPPDHVTIRNRPPLRCLPKHALKDLDLGWHLVLKCPGATEDGCIAKVLRGAVGWTGGAEHLRSLCLVEAELSELDSGDLSQVLEDLPALERLRFNRCRLHCKMFDSMTEANISELRLNYCGVLGRRDQIFPITATACLTGLKSFSITCANVKLTAAPTFTTSDRREFCQGLVGIEDLVSGWSMLRSLWVPGSVISDRAVEVLLEGCKHLTSVKAKVLRPVIDHHTGSFPLRELLVEECSVQDLAYLPLKGLTSFALPAESGHEGYSYLPWIHFLNGTSLGIAEQAVRNLLSCPALPRHILLRCNDHAGALPATFSPFCHLQAHVRGLHVRTMMVNMEVLDKTLGCCVEELDVLPLEESPNNPLSEAVRVYMLTKPQSFAALRVMWLRHVSSEWLEREDLSNLSQYRPSLERVFLGLGGNLRDINLEHCRDCLGPQVEVVPMKVGYF